MFLWKYIAVLLIFQKSLTNRSDAHIMRAIKDFLLMQKDLMKVSFYLCWPNSKKVLLAEYLNKYFIDFRSTNRTNVHGYESATPQLFLIDLTCEGYADILYEVANKKLAFQQPRRWLAIVDEQTYISPILELLVDSQFYLIKKISFNFYLFYAIYKISKWTNEFVTNDIAAWSTVKAFVYFKHLNAVRNRTNLMGITLNISYVITNNESLKHLWDYRDKHIDGISKLNYILIHHVTDFMNASRNFILRNTWGYKNESTNMYDGLVGDLQSGLAEFAGTAAFFTLDRISVIDYIAPTTPTRAKFIFRAPPLSYVTNVFTLPFERMVWFCGFLLLTVISIVVYVIIKWEWNDREFQNVLEKKQNVLKPKYVDVLVMVLGAICQQGSEAEPKSAAGRIATIFVFMTLMFMYTSYSANIVALLQSTSEGIKSLDDLLNSRIKLGVEDKPYSHYYFKMQTERIRRAIYTEKVAPKGQTPNFMNIEVGIRKMRDEFFAFHVECASGYKLVADIFQENEKCGLREIEYWQIIDPWVAVKKNSSYRELAKIAFRKIHESGLQNREFKRLYAKKPVCESRGSNFISVGLIDCYYAFLIFVIGVLIALGVLLSEIFYRRKYSN